MVRYLLIGFGLLVSACAYYAPPAGVSDEVAAHKPAAPIRAFEKVGRPMPAATTGADATEDLSTEILRLQDARRAYHRELELENVQTQHRQQRCRASAKGQEIPIEDGGVAPATYCQKVPSASAAPGGERKNHE